MITVHLQVRFHLGFSLFINRAFAALQLLLQLFVGIVVLVRSSVELNRFKQEIEANLGKSFTFIPFIVIIVSTFFFFFLLQLIGDEEKQVFFLGSVKHHGHRGNDLPYPALSIPFYSLNQRNHYIRLYYSNAGEECYRKFTNRRF